MRRSHGGSDMRATVPGSERERTRGAEQVPQRAHTLRNGDVTERVLFAPTSAHRPQTQTRTGGPGITPDPPARYSFEEELLRRRRRVELTASHATRRGRGDLAGALLSGGLALRLGLDLLGSHDILLVRGACVTLTPANVDTLSQSACRDPFTLAPRPQPRIAHTFPPSRTLVRRAARSNAGRGISAFL